MFVSAQVTTLMLTTLSTNVFAKLWTIVFVRWFSAGVRIRYYKELQQALPRHRAAAVVGAGNEVAYQQQAGGAGTSRAVVFREPAE